jgi:DNA-binding response OmpR family regulator
MMSESANTILIIDDSSDNLRVLSKTLSTHGYTVRCVTNGPMAFISIRNSPPDLILLDIRMPEMNGYEVCRILKQDPTMQDIPVVFLSALDDVEDIVRAFQIGGVDYITKPFQTEEVLARIRNQLTIQKLKQELSCQNQNLLREIEEHKKTEQALYQEIQRRILMEASLQDAKNAAEAANYVKSEFLAQMSHELRTPLNIILGFTNLIKADSTLGAKGQEYVSSIEDSGYCLLKLINNILSVARSKSSQLSLVAQEFDLHALLDSALSLWQTQAQQKGFRFEYHQSARVPQYVQSDENKIRQIFMYLIGNAIQAAEQGKIVLQVDADRQSLMGLDSVCQLSLELCHSGLSITFDGSNILFSVTPETVINPSLLQEMELNFFLIRQFAQLMNGDVIVKNIPHEGCVIKVYFTVRFAESLSNPLPSPTNSSNYFVQPILDEGKLTSEALEAVMSRDWLMELHQAAVKGFDQQILSLLHKIPSTHESLAKTLEFWTRNFQFEQIIELTEQLVH